MLMISALIFSHLCRSGYSYFSDVIPLDKRIWKINGNHRLPCSVASGTWTRYCTGHCTPIRRWCIIMERNKMGRKPLLFLTFFLFFLLNTVAFQLYATDMSSEGKAYIQSNEEVNIIMENEQEPLNSVADWTCYRLIPGSIVVIWALPQCLLTRIMFHRSSNSGGEMNRSHLIWRV